MVCRSRSSAVNAARFIGAGRPASAARAKLTRADLLLIATPDNAIADAVALIRRNAAAIGSPIVLHTSGALSSDVLGPLAQLGLAVGSCHPLQTFESPSRAIRRVGGSHFCIEGDRRSLRAARLLVRRIGARHFTIPTEAKALYHAAAVLASGGVVALLSLSLEMLSLCGLSEREARLVLMPLVDGTIANVRTLGPAPALTGPVRRGDTDSIERNMRAVADVDSRLLALYRLLAERGADLMERQGMDRAHLTRLRRLLKKFRP